MSLWGAPGVAKSTHQWRKDNRCCEMDTDLIRICADPLRIRNTDYDAMQHTMVRCNMMHRIGAEPRWCDKQASCHRSSSNDHASVTPQASVMPAGAIHITRSRARSKRRASRHNQNLCVHKNIYYTRTKGYGIMRSWLQQAATRLPVGSPVFIGKISWLKPRKLKKFTVEGHVTAFSQSECFDRSLELSRRVSL